MIYSLKLRSEERLLIELCRLRFSDELKEKIRLLISNITDWEYFKYLAHMHGVSALTCRNLEKLELIDKIPATGSVFLKKALMMSLSRNTFNAKSLTEVLALLNGAGVRTVLLKGFVLEFTVYGNSGIRQMSDIDILVDRPHCMLVRHLLIKAGYESLPLKSVVHKLILADIGKHMPSLIKNGTSIDIHHDLFGKDRKALTSQFINTSYEVDLNGEKTWFPEPKLFFLYLVKHLNVHEESNESQLRLYTDLVVMIEKYGDQVINQALTDLAVKAGLKEILLRYLGILREIWEVTFPEWLNILIDNCIEKKILEKFRFFLLSPKNNPQADRPVIYRKIIEEIPGFHRRFLFILGDVFPTITFMKSRYKCRYSIGALLYYPHRLGKLIWLMRL